MHCDIYLLNNSLGIQYTMVSVTLSPYNYICSIEIVSIATDGMLGFLYHLLKLQHCKHTHTSTMSLCIKIE